MSPKRFLKSKKPKLRISDFRFLILLILGIVSLVLGLIGFTKNGISLGEERSFLDNLYLMFGLLSMNSGAVSGTVSWELQVSRFSIPILTASTAILAFAMVFSQQMQKIKLWFIRDHIIICGLGRKGFRLANQFKDIGEKIVIIEIDENNNRIEALRSLGIVVINGDANNPEILHRVRINRAKNIISVIGDEGKNAEVAVLAERISLYRKKGVLNCVIHIEDPQLWHLLREKEFNIVEMPHFRLELFNIFNRGAKLLVNKHNPWNAALKKTDIKNRLIIIGLGKLGQSLVVQAALRWREMDEEDQHRLRIMVIDLDAAEKKDYLCVRYPYLGELCVFETLDMEVKSSEFQRAEFLLQNGEICDIDSIFICLDNDSLGLHSGLTLYHKVRNHNIPVIVRMVEDAGLALLLQDEGLYKAAYKNLYAFPLLNQTCTPDLVLRGTHEVLARELHVAYLEGIQSRNADVELETWDELTEVTKEKNRKQADRIAIILVKHGYRIAPLSDWNMADKIFIGKKADEKVESMARMEHSLWCEEMIEDGWTYGKTKSEKQRTNPALLTWETLCEDQSNNYGEVNQTIKFILDLPKILIRAGFQIEEINKK